MDNRSSAIACYLLTTSCSSATNSIPDSISVVVERHVWQPDSELPALCCAIATADTEVELTFLDTFYNPSSKSMQRDRKRLDAFLVKGRK